MHTSSHDPRRDLEQPGQCKSEASNDAHMWPCLSCTKHGDLQGGSMVYDQTLGKYSILLHLRLKMRMNGRPSRLTTLRGRPQDHPRTSELDSETILIAIACRSLEFPWWLGPRLPTDNNLGNHTCGL